jgi:hypothetical protein
MPLKYPFHLLKQRLIHSVPTHIKHAKSLLGAPYPPSLLAITRRAIDRPVSPTDHTCVVFHESQEMLKPAVRVAALIRVACPKFTHENGGRERLSRFQRNVAPRRRDFLFVQVVIVVVVGMKPRIVVCHVDHFVRLFQHKRKPSHVRQILRVIEPAYHHQQVLADAMHDLGTFQGGAVPVRLGRPTTATATTTAPPSPPVCCSAAAAGGEPAGQSQLVAQLCRDDVGLRPRGVRRRCTARWG